MDKLNIKDELIKSISEATKLGNIEVLDKLLTGYQQIAAKENERSFNKDFALMQGELGAINKNKETLPSKKSNVTFKYATLDEIMIIIKPVLSKFGFSLSSTLKSDVFITTLYHKDGHFISTYNDFKEATLLLANSFMGKMQQRGSTQSYLIRYAIISLLNLSTNEDDEGELLKMEAKRKKEAEARANKNKIKLNNFIELVKKADNNQVKFGKNSQTLEDVYNSMLGIKQDGDDFWNKGVEAYEGKFNKKAEPIEKF